MDRKNKYYELIIELIKKHRKFPGYEAILEDIADDVYSHSEVIINSINNDDVVRSYIEKVISTSIITVPKKMNFQNPEKIEKSNVVNVLEQIAESKKEKQALKEQEAVYEELINSDYESDIKTNALEETDLVSKKANIELVDKMINSINTEEANIQHTLTEFNEPDELDQDETSSMDTDINAINNNEENISYSQLSEIEDFSGITVEEPSTEDENIQENLETTSLIEEEEENDDDIILSMSNNDSENSLPEDETNYTFEYSSENSQESSEDSLEVLTIDNSDKEDNSEFSFETDAESIHIYDDSNTENIELIDEQQEEKPIENESDNESEEFEAVDMVDLSIMTEQEENDTEEYTILEDNNIEEVTEQDIQNNDDSEIDTLQQNIMESSDFEESLVLEEGLNESINNDENIELLLPNDNNINIDINSENELLDENISDMDQFQDITDLQTNDDFEFAGIDNDDNIIQFSEELDDKKEINYKLTDYSAFNYEPKENQNDVDIDVLKQKIIQLDNSQPDLNILRIFDLKYKQNYSVEKIAEELSMEKQQVVAALNELIELV